jgi:glutathione S-transferase
MKLQEATLARNRRGGRIFLAEKGIEVPLEPVDIGNAENRQPPFLAKNPLGGVPVLELADGTCIAESVAICRCFGELHPDPPLMGVDAQDNAVIEMCNRRMELELALPMMNVFRHGDPFFAGRIEQVPDWSEASRRHVAGRMEWLDRELAAREFVAGDRYPIADVTALVGVDFQRVSMISIREEHPQPEAMARGGLEPAEREGLRPRRRWSAAAPGVFPYQPTSWAGDGRSSSGSGGASNRAERSAGSGPAATGATPREASPRQRPQLFQPVAARPGSRSRRRLGAHGRSDG